MAHVIEPPKPENFKKKRCPHCRSLIGYVPNDVKSYHGTDYGGGPDGREWVVCPGCGKDITLRTW
jgi:hypothetical protein